MCSSTKRTVAMESKAKLFWLQNETICQYHMHHSHQHHILVHNTYIRVHTAYYYIYITYTFGRLYVNFFSSLFSSLPQSNQNLLVNSKVSNWLSTVAVSFDSSKHLSVRALHTHQRTSMTSMCVCVQCLCCSVVTFWLSPSYSVLLLLPKEEKKYIN